MNPLNELIQSRLRQSVQTRYINGRLWIAFASWPGATKALASFRAYNELYYLNEYQMRNRLGLEHRPCIREIDEIRDCLRKLKRRLRGNRAAISRVRTLYSHLDGVEQYLLS